MPPRCPLLILNRVGPAFLVVWTAEEKAQSGPTQGSVAIAFDHSLPPQRCRFLSLFVLFAGPRSRIFLAINALRRLTR